MSTIPSTAATRLLEEKRVAYGEHPYRYQEHGGTRVSARELGVGEHAVVKTLVMEDDEKRPLVVPRLASGAAWRDVPTRTPPAPR